MIKYSNNGLSHLFWVKGSVFPSAILIALPCGLCSAVLKRLADVEYLPPLEAALNNGAWSGFVFLVGFLIVFRTSQAYARFWDGCSATKKMSAEWFASCSCLISFCRMSSCAENDVKEFQSCLIRLFSMLHAAAWGSIEDSTITNYADLEAFKFELIDAAGIDSTSLLNLGDESLKVELIYQWIQNLIVTNMQNEILDVPAPILSRAFQELSNGYVAFHDAKKISLTPFPFPYSQMCDVLLIAHWLMVPFVVYSWVKSAFWACALSFVQVFVLWCLNFIARELENPFGTDANDLDGRGIQIYFNSTLTLLLRPHAKEVPFLTKDAVDYHSYADDHTDNFHHASSFADVLQIVEDGALAEEEEAAEPVQTRRSRLKRRTTIRHRLVVVPESDTNTRASHCSQRGTSQYRKSRNSLGIPLHEPTLQLNAFQISLAIGSRMSSMQASSQAAIGIPEPSDDLMNDSRNSSKPASEISDSADVSKPEWLRDTSNISVDTW